MSKKTNFDEVVNSCHEIGLNYIRNWAPIDPSWPIKYGASYLRLSTDEQVLVDRGSLEQQIHICCQNAESRSRHDHVNYRITEFFIDAGLSGRQKDRPAFLRLRRGIRSGKIQFVTIKELSRLTRDLQIWTEFFTECQTAKCDLIIPGFPFDPNSPAAMLQWHNSAVFAQYEAQVTSKRIKDSVRSAMLTSGKFNSTHSVLGLKKKMQNGRFMPGFYEPDYEELKTVCFIMKKFVEFGSHQKLLEYLEENQIFNKGGRKFKRNSLHTLLTNPKYIGKWYLNPENKNRNQDHLRLEEHYHEVSLSHGCVIDKELWDDVQNTLKRVGKMGKNTRVKRVFPLSGGILQLEDQSTFRGFSGTGRTTKSFYYLNTKHKIMLRTDLIEQATIKVVAELIENTPSLQKAIGRASERVKDNLEILKDRLQFLKIKLLELDSEKDLAKKRLNILLSAQCTNEEIQQLKDDYLADVKSIQKNKTSTENLYIELEDDLNRAQETTFSWQSIAKFAFKAQEQILENDPITMKNAYYTLFKRIIVGTAGENGERQITYVLNNPLDHEERSYCFSEKMVEAGGIEPPSASDPR